MADELHLILPLIRHSLVKGQDDLHLVAGLGQRLGQTSGHVGQTAGLAERNRLRSGKQNLHWKNPPLEIRAVYSAVSEK